MVGCWDIQDKGRAVSDWFGNQSFRVGIVGGGRAGQGILRFFGDTRFATVAFVVDPDPQAPGMVEAVARGIGVFADTAEALQRHVVDFVFEGTGVPRVQQELESLVANRGIHLVPTTLTRMMVQVLDDNGTRIREEVSGVVGPMKAELAHSLEGSQSLVGRINQIMSSMQMLALNASIEAAKAGVHGRGFSVVADHMGKSVETVRKLTLEIDGMNKDIIGISTKIDGVLEKLK